MPDLKKVIDDLKDISKYFFEVYRHENEKEESALALERSYIIDDAIELLKEQEPRVMEFSEIASFDGVVYLEDIDKTDVIRAICNGYIVTYDLLSFSTKRGAPVGMVEDYNKRWRAWTSRPTEEQRKEAKWE